jgi:site-specific recombinase XerD
MAGLRKLKGKYYARVYNVYIAKKKRYVQEKLIPLNTSLIKEAIPKKHEVNRFEEAIKAGEVVNFYWQTKSKESDVISLTIHDIIPIYLNARINDGLRSSTLELHKDSLTHFSDAIDGKTVVESIRDFEINKFKEYFEVRKWGQKSKRDYSIHTRNIHLRNIRTFLNWLASNDYILKAPKVSQLMTPKQKPVYLSNDEFDAVLNAVDRLTFKNKLDHDHYKRAFEFFRLTGCRRSEPFHAFLDGNFLIIDPETSKTHCEREVFLNSELILIYYELINRFENKKQKLEREFVGRYSEVFRKACLAAGLSGKKFHSLRHTFAVRRYLETRDLYRVAKELGHKSIITTQIYANFNFRRLEQAFPDLAKDYLKRFDVDMKSTRNPHPDTEPPDTGVLNIAVS